MDQVAKSPEYKDCRVLFAFMSLPREVRTGQLIERAWEDGKKIALPVTDMKSRQIHFYYVESYDQLKEGVMHIREPRQGLPCADADAEKDPGKILMIMPGVAFDLERNRLGHGGGFYDRYLEKYPKVRTAAVALDFQILDKIPAKEHDLRPDKIYTPSRII